METTQEAIVKIQERGDGGVRRDGNGGDGDMSGPEGMFQRKGERDALMGWTGHGVGRKKSTGSALFPCELLSGW